MGNIVRSVTKQVETQLIVFGIMWNCKPYTPHYDRVGRAQLRQTARLEKRRDLLPAGGTTWSSNLLFVRFQIFLITDLSSSFAWSMLPVCQQQHTRTHARTHTHTHTHTNTRLTALFPGLPGWAGTRKVNQSGFYWSKRQWVTVASAGPYASLHLAPYRYHASTPPLSFFTDRMPFLPPNQQRIVYKKIMATSGVARNFRQGVRQSVMNDHTLAR